MGFSKGAIGAVALVVMSIAPASAQFATKGEIDILKLQIIDLDVRLRALEREKTDRQQAERNAEAARQNDAAWQMWRDCRAYRQRIAEAQKAGRPGPDDTLENSNCQFADKFEADIVAKTRVLDQKKR